MEHTPPTPHAQRILEARARALARPPAVVEAADAFIELVTFHSDAEQFGVPTRQVYEAQPLRARNWSRVPCAPAYIIGIVNLRGHICSIMDLSRFFGRPARPLPDTAHILLVRGGRCADGQEMELSLLADDVPHVRRVPLSSLNAPPSTVSEQTQTYVRGITPDMLIILDVDRFLSDPRLSVHEEV